MPNQESELHLRRGRLLERIAAQRATLSRNAQPIRIALDKTDRLLERTNKAADYVKRHPSLAALTIATALAMKTDRIWRWTKRGLFAWQTWRTLRGKLQIFNFRGYL